MMEKIIIIIHISYFSIFQLSFSSVSGQMPATSLRIPAESISDQLGHGAKRITYYLNTLVEACDNVGDLNNWIIFMDSYLKCDANAQPKFTTKTSRAIASNRDEPIQRLTELCAAWPRKRKCSSRLASKLDSCLGLQLEDGRAGTNALGLADAHMNFICQHKIQYIGSLKTFDETGEILPMEKQASNCFYELHTPIKHCIREREFNRPQITFCQNFELAKICLNESFKMCKNENTTAFMKTMLEQMKVDLKCSI